jgi:succinate-semialdehyde dehydrogenase/glutarate-semialdehyde dehydrogenase
MKAYSVYLNGRFVQGREEIDVINPATGEAFARMSRVSRTEVAQAIRDAAAAFDPWRRLTAKARGEWLHKIADEVNRRRDEIARIITTENGKPLAQSTGEVAMSIDHLHWFAEEARRGYGRLVPNWVENKRNLVIKSPLGVVGAISPWNFPLVLAVRKVAPALAGAGRAWSVPGL